MEVTRFIASVDRMRQILMVEPFLDPLGNLSEMLVSPLEAAVPRT
jgi:hypothetical protein